MKRRSLLIGAALFPLSVLAQGRKRLREIYILAGQSNMTEYPDGTLGLHGWFKDRMVSHRQNADIVLAPCAVGATKMQAWSRNWSTSSLYGAMLARVRYELSLGGSIKGLLWWQGESDCGRYPAPPNNAWPEVISWAGDFCRFVADVRVDLVLPDLPVVFAQLGPEPSGNWNYAAWGFLQAQQASISAPKVSMIETKDLPELNINNVHLSAAGYEVAGYRFADAMNALL